FGKFDDAPGSILHHLRRVSDRDSETGTVTEISAHGVRTITDDDQDIADAGLMQSLDDMVEDRFSTNLDHRFRQFVGQVAHSGAPASPKKNRFPDQSVHRLSSLMKSAMRSSAILICSRLVA